MRLEAALVVMAFPLLTQAQVLITQAPVSGGGVARWSQLWQDPGPNENDLDGDSVCWADFTLAQPTAIQHLEWWGTGACELGFRIEFWKQDPGTIAYQPWGLFYYGGDHTVTPQARFDTTAYTVTPGAGGLNHYTLDLSTPVTIPANTAANPRWFFSVIGLTHQPFVTWNWAQSTVGSHHTFQFIRGGTSGSGPLFRSLGDGRAMVLADAAGLCPADVGSQGGLAGHDGLLDNNDFIAYIDLFFNQSAQADRGAAGGLPGSDGLFDNNDFIVFIDQFFAGC